MSNLSRWKNSVKVCVAYSALPPGAVPNEVIKLANAVAADEADLAIDVATGDLSDADFDAAASVAAQRNFAENVWVDEEDKGHEYLQSLVEELRDFAKLLGRDPTAFVLEYRSLATETYWAQTAAGLHRAHESALESPRPAMA